MKTIKRLALLFIICGFAANNAKSQADVYRGGLWMMTIYTAPDGGTWGPYYSTETQRVFTPSGSIMITTTFQLDLDDPRVPENGVYKMPSVASYYEDGEGYQTLDGEKLYTADGKTKAVYHVNGQQEKLVFTDNTCMPFNDCTNTPEIVCGDAVKEIQYWNGNFHMKFYGAFIGQTTGFHYSWTGICNERIKYPGGIITVPLLLKRENEIIAVVYYNWGVTIGSNGEITLDDEVPGTYFVCK
jgi:hypothetical protein